MSGLHRSLIESVSMQEIAIYLEYVLDKDVLFPDEILLVRSQRAYLTYRYFNWISMNGKRFRIYPGRITHVLGNRLCGLPDDYDAKSQLSIPKKEYST